MRAFKALRAASGEDNVSRAWPRWSAPAAPPCMYASERTECYGVTNEGPEREWATCGRRDGEDTCTAASPAPSSAAATAVLRAASISSRDMDQGSLRTHLCFAGRLIARGNRF